METWSIPLILATGAFLAFLLWRVRPRMGLGLQGESGREARLAAQARVEAARTDAERALALCDAADLMRAGEAKGMYLRALRADPASPAVIGRVVAGLSHRPRTLESLLWRYLSSTPWTESKEATAAALEALRVLYDGPLHHAVRARAMAHARDALVGAPASEPVRGT